MIACAFDGNDLAASSKLFIEISHCFDGARWIRGRKGLQERVFFIDRQNSLAIFIAWMLISSALP